MRQFRFLAMMGLAFSSAAFGQTQIDVTLTTLGPVGLAPAFAAFHDGSYDIFDVDGTSTASAGLELLAEVGDVSTLVAATPAGAISAGFAPGGPFAPGGGTVTQRFTVSNLQTSFSIAAMILPSNDWFIGTDNAVDVSSLISAAPGQSLSFDLTTGYDAGTETEDFSFAPGGGLVGITTAADPAGGTSTTEPIQPITSADPFASFANIEPAGFDTTSIDFTSGPIASVTLTVVPEPTGLSLLGMALMGLMAWRRRRSYHAARHETLHPPAKREGRNVTILALSSCARFRIKYLT